MENAKDNTTPPIPKYPNLRPFTPLDRERNVRIAKMGGKASGEARARRKTFAEEIKMALNARIQASHPKYAEMKRMLRSAGVLGMNEEPTNQTLIIFGMLQAAQKKPEAAVFLRDSIGEKPIERFEDVGDPPPPVVIGIRDPAFIEAERKRQEEERAEIIDIKAEPETPPSQPEESKSPEQAGDGETNGETTDKATDGEIERTQSQEEEPTAADAQGKAADEPNQETADKQPQEAPPAPSPTPSPEPSTPSEPPKQETPLATPPPQHPAPPKTQQDPRLPKRPSGKFVMLPAGVPRRY